MTEKPTPLQRAQEWFNLDMYDGAAGFGRQQWIEQIAKRAAIQSAINANDQSLLNALVPDLIVAPLADWPFKYGKTTQIIQDLDYATGAVIPLGFSDLDRFTVLRKDIPLNGIDAIDEWAMQGDELRALRRFGHLKVDLNARDKDIISGFQRWLTSHRAAVDFDGLKKLYRNNVRAETADWHLTKVLPYFDLMAWYKWSGHHLVELDIVDLLFPGDPNDLTRDTLRRLREKAAWVITLSNAMALSKAVGS
jgi:hypothetical protein